MQLSDLPFLLLFLPLVLAVFVYLRSHARLATLWLLAASIAYYCSFGWKSAPILFASILFNFVLAPHVVRSRALLIFGVAANAAFLALFKCWLAPIPVGMSFFTFVQIAYLLEARAGEVLERDPVRFAFMVSFFPKILAGPIVRPSEFLPQIGNAARRQDVTDGTALFALGLIKKLAANAAGGWAAPAFLAAQSRPLSLSESWVGVLAFTLQIYFDFSGYSDMAIGIARWFGYKLPANFNSPYKAASMIDFWRRWHMSFTRFLTDNVYFNLPGNRGRIRRHVNLMITMVLCGIWHGSTWTFVAWGALHGLLLVSNHLWRALRESLTWKQKAPVAARVFTMFAVMASWVLFGSRTWTGVTHIFRGMLGGAGMGRVPSVEACLWLAGLGIVACAGPNSQEIVRSTGKFLRSFTDGKRSIEWSWIAPGALVLWICGILFWLSQTSPASPFIYAIF